MSQKERKKHRQGKERMGIGRKTHKEKRKLGESS